MDILKGILKKGIAIGLALSIVAGAGAQAVGTVLQTGQTTTPPVAEQVVLKSLYEDKDQAFWPYLDQVVILEKHGSLKTSALPEKAKYLDTKDARHELALQWEIKAIDLQKAGLHQVAATPVLTKDQVLAEGYDGKVTYPVFRKGTDAALEVKALEQHKLEDILIAKDSKDPLDELTITTTGLRYSVGTTGYVLSDDQWKWEWDVSKVDTCVAGKATVTGTLKDQPDWIKLAESEKKVEHTVYVMPDDSIQLMAPTDLTEKGELTFRWIYDSEKVTKAVLEMEKDGKWETCDTCWYTYQMPTEEKTEDGKKIEAQPAALILDLTKIPAGSYTFRLNYVDEVSGKAEDRTTEALYITVPENIKKLLEEADGKIPAELKIGEKPEVKPEQEPEKEPEKDPETETEIPKDIVTDTYITLSGKSLAEKIAEGKTVPFAMKGATLEIPSQLLTDLKLKDTDLITVAVTVPKTGTVQVVVNAGGKVITDLKGSVVKMNYTLAKNKTLTCKDLTGKLSPKVTYDSKTKVASFPINQAGTYTLTAKTVTTTTTKKPTTTTTTKKPTTTTNKNTTTNKTTVAKKYNAVTNPAASNPTNGLTSGTNRYEEDAFFLEDENYEEEPFFFEDGASEDTLFLEDMEEENEDVPRTWWDEQTGTGLALIAAMGLLVAAGLLLRKWFSE